jgi:hypothetical protein
MDKIRNGGGKERERARETEGSVRIEKAVSLLMYKVSASLPARRRDEVDG